MNMCDFGGVLKALRKSRNLTQSELGGRIGLSKAVISKYENGMGYPTLDTLIRTAAFFGVTTDYLLGVSRGKTVDVSDLTESQIEALHRIIAEFDRTNRRR